MNSSSYPTIEDVPRLLRRWRDSGKRDVRFALLARSALTDTCEALLESAEKESRGFTPTEQRAFDAHAIQAREITEFLAEYRRAAEADLVAAGFPAEYCRLPF